MAQYSDINLNNNQLSPTVHYYQYMESLYVLCSARDNYIEKKEITMFEAILRVLQDIGKTLDELKVLYVMMFMYNTKGEVVPVIVFGFEETDVVTYSDDLNTIVLRDLIYKEHNLTPNINRMYYNGKRFLHEYFMFFGPGLAGKHCHHLRINYKTNEVEPVLI